jgi:hypothetical protein
MGSKEVMLRSLGEAANFVMKLHVAALHASETIAFQGLDLYPMIDGVYACSPEQGPILAFMKDTLVRLVLGFLLETNPLHRFTVRCGLSFGPIAKGRSTRQCSGVLDTHQDYSDRVLLGMPLSQAYECERMAPPFGVYLHESSRAFAPSGTSVLSGTLWKWWKFRTQPGDNDVVTELRRVLETHYQWCGRHVATLSYEAEAIHRHHELAREYFSSE